MTNDAMGALPADSREALSHFTDSLVSRLRDNLLCIAVFGGVAKGCYEEHTSDLNLLVVLQAVSLGALEHIASGLKIAQRSINVQLMTLAESGLAECVEVFATKFFDMREHHVLLHGRDLLQELSIPQERLVRQARRELVNLKLRLRQTYLRRAGRDEILDATLERSRKTARVNVSSIILTARAGEQSEVLRSCLELWAAPVSDMGVETRCADFLREIEQALQALGPI